LNTVLAAQLPLLHGKPQPLLLSTIFDKTLVASESEWALPMVGTLGTFFLCYLMKASMTILSLTLPISAGVVAPVMVIGGLIGRMYGQLMPDWFLQFLLSAPGQTTPVTEAEKGALLARFAIVGAAAHATAVTRAFAMAITVYEVLTLPSSLLPLCTSCLAAVFVANKVSLPFFDMALTGRGLGGISELTHSDKANKCATCIMRPLDLDADCIFEYTTVADMRLVLKRTSEEVEQIPILHNVECKWSSDGVAPLLKASIARASLQGLLASNKLGRDEEDVHLLASEYVVPKDADTPPIVCLNPIQVASKAFVKDVYIILKASEAEAVYVTDSNLLLGIIGYKELLGHRLDKPWFG